jgi:acyl-CoA thioester hydrolase
LPYVCRARLHPVIALGYSRRFLLTSLSPKMYRHTINIRVRYAETDQMGYVYYGNYATYYEVARVEAIRALGFSYAELEQAGTIMPVLELRCKYIRPARYDDLLRVELYIKELPQTRIKFEYEIYNQEDTLLNVGDTTLVFVDQQTGRPCPPPDGILAALAPSFAAGAAAA